MSLGCEDAKRYLAGSPNLLYFYHTRQARLSMSCRTCTDLLITWARYLSHRYNQQLFLSLLPADLKSVVPPKATWP